MMADPDLRAQLYLDSMEEELVTMPTGYATNIPTARLDSFFTRHANGDFTLNFIEFNGESPAGMAYNDVLAELFLETPLMQRFQERYQSSRCGRGVMPWMRCCVSITSGAATTASCPTWPSWTGRACPPPASFGSLSPTSPAMAST